MKWYWIANIAGIISPWLIMARTIRIGFEEKGLLTGVGVWAGISMVTIPIMLLIMWIFEIAR